MLNQANFPQQLINPIPIFICLPIQLLLRPSVHPSKKILFAGFLFPVNKLARQVDSVVK